MWRYISVCVLKKCLTLRVLKFDKKRHDAKKGSVTQTHTRNADSVPFWCHASPLPPCRFGAFLVSGLILGRHSDFFWLGWGFKHQVQILISIDGLFCGCCMLWFKPNTRKAAGSQHWFHPPWCGATRRGRGRGRGMSIRHIIYLWSQVLDVSGVRYKLFSSVSFCTK